METKAKDPIRINRIIKQSVGSRGSGTYALGQLPALRCSNRHWELLSNFLGVDSVPGKRRHVSHYGKRREDCSENPGALTPCPFQDRLCKALVALAGWGGGDSLFP